MTSRHGTLWQVTYVRGKREGACWMKGRGNGVIEGNYHDDLRHGSWQQTLSTDCVQGDEYLTDEGYAVGGTSSRKIEKATHDDVASRVLAAGDHPHFTSINEFRSTHRRALGNLFDQVLQECMSAGLVKLGHVAIDGTKMKANASKHKAMSYERMQKEEARLKTEEDRDRVVLRPSRGGRR